MWGWVLLALVGLLVALAWIPIHLVVDASRHDREGRATARIEWLFGLVSQEIRSGPAERAKPPSKKPARRYPLAALTTDGFPAALRRALRRLFRAASVRRLDARARVGLGDPADTGLALGLAFPLLALMPLPARADVRIEPAWEPEPRFDAELHARARVWPALVLAAMIAFLLTPAVWRAIRAWRQGA